MEFAGKKFEASDKTAARKVAEALGFVVEQETTNEDKAAKGPARNRHGSGGAHGHLPAIHNSQHREKCSTSKPPAPFITSTLQQSASSRLGFGAQRAMRLAQTLYESGHITYMRTDSTNLSPEALAMARDYIKAEFGPEYVPEKPNYYSSSNKSAQEAHEAIRPTDANFRRRKRTPNSGRMNIGCTN